MNYFCHTTSDHQSIEIVFFSYSILCAKGDRAADLCNGDLCNGLVCNGKLTGVAFLFSRCDSVLDTGYMKITAPSVRSFIRSQTGI